MRIIAAFLFCALFLFAHAVSADEKADKQKQLTQLKARIEKLRHAIEVKENSKSSYSRQLRQIEKQIGALSQNIRNSSKQLKARQQSLRELQENKNHIAARIQGQNDQLAQQLHTAYTLGQQEQLKLFFSQENASVLQRNMTYYEYFSRYRLGLIDDAQRNIARLLENERKISSAKQALEQALSAQKRQKSELTRDKKKRQNIVANLDKQLKKQGSHLSQLEENAQNLKQLIDSLSDILTDIPAPPASHQKFAKLKGKLAWPVKGKVKKLFGRPKPPSNLRWQGVVIQAPTGNNVRAVSHGRVAFADWLRGMGNLIIIDHGNGYMSLYGHNQSLYKAAGEWVEPGDVIASIGNSGGQKTPGLYFEIRKKGKPQNPSRWCKTKNWFAT